MVSGYDYSEFINSRIQKVSAHNERGLDRQMCQESRLPIKGLLLKEGVYLFDIMFNRNIILLELRTTQMIILGWRQILEFAARDTG